MIRIAFAVAVVVAVAFIASTYLASMVQGLDVLR